VVEKAFRTLESVDWRQGTQRDKIFNFGVFCRLW